MAALIYIKTVTGYNFSLEVELSNTVKSVKEKIQEEKGVSSHQQRLIFTDKLLEDDKALTDYGITRYNTIHLVRGGMQIFAINATHEMIIPLEYDRSDTVKTVKVKLENKVGIPYDQQRFVFAGKTLEDEKEISEYSITRESVIKLHLNGDFIFVNFDGKMIVVEVKNLLITIEDFKVKIQAKEGIPPDQQRLQWCDKELDDDRSLLDYNVQRGCTVDLVTKQHIGDYKLLTFYQEYMYIFFVVTKNNSFHIEKAVAEMNERSCTRGEPEIVFSFDGKGEIMLALPYAEGLKICKGDVDFYCSYGDILEYTIEAPEDSNCEIPVSGTKDPSLSITINMELNRVRLLSHVTATASKDIEIEPKEQIVSVIEATFDEKSTLREFTDDALPLHTKKMQQQDKFIQFNYLTSFTDSFTQVRFNKQKLYTIKRGNEEHTLNWEEHGITLFVPQDAIPSTITSCDIAVVPVIEGSFTFPPDTTPVSAMYAIGTSCKLKKPIKIGIQHCVELTDPSHCDQLSFAKATHVDCLLPYRFKAIDGGQFLAYSQYGFLDCASFSLFTIIQKRIARFRIRAVSRYKLLTFYDHTPGTRVWSINFAVTKNINHLIENATAEMSKNSLVRREPEAIFSFNNDEEIEFKIEKETIKDWEVIAYISPCKIQQKDVNSYSFYNGSLPKVAVRIEGPPEGTSFTHQIPVSGTRGSSLSNITIHLEEKSQACKTKPAHHIQYENKARDPTTTTGPSFDDLMDDVAAEAPDQWMNVGIKLGISYPRLNAIKTQNDSAEACFAAVFYEWKSAGTIPYTWETIANVLESKLVKRLDLAETIKKKYK